jgi:hypothetical protein
MLGSWTRNSFLLLSFFFLFSTKSYLGDKNVCLKMYSSKTNCSYMRPFLRQTFLQGKITDLRKDLLWKHT